MLIRYETIGSGRCMIQGSQEHGEVEFKFLCDCNTVNVNQRK